MVKCLHVWIAALLLILFAVVAPVTAGEKEDRARKARAALALAGAPPKTAVAPAPHPKVTGYPEGYAKATSDLQPLVVYVGVPVTPVRGAVVVRIDSFAGVDAPAVVVGYPVADRLFISATLKGDATPKEVQAAADAAGRKIDAPSAKDTPAPKPLDWSVLVTAEEEIAADAEFACLFRRQRFASCAPLSQPEPAPATAAATRIAPQFGHAGVGRWRRSGDPEE